MSEATNPSGASSPPQYGQFGGAQESYEQPYGQTPTGAPELASWIHRVGGYVIDILIVGVPSGIIGAIAGSQALDRLLGLIGWIIIGYLNGAQGASPGKRLVGLRLVRDRDGQLLGGGMGIVREICHLLDTLAILLGWLWPLWDSKRQTFADKIVGTVVIREARGRYS